MRLFLTFILLFSIFLFFTCSDDDTQTISGTITLGSNTTNGAYYVYLDTDTKITNGYVKRSIANFAIDQTTANYSIDTTDVTEGSYYLLIGSDYYSTDNMDSNNPKVWERQGWYGSSSINPPSNPNVGKTGKYDITLYEVP